MSVCREQGSPEVPVWDADVMPGTVRARQKTQVTSAEKRSPSRVSHSGAGNRAGENQTLEG